MSGSKPETWHLITRALGVVNFLSTIVVAIIGWFLIRTIDQFDHHLEKIDIRFDSQEVKNVNFEHRITLVQGQCCKRSFSQSKDDDGG